MMKSKHIHRKLTAIALLSLATLSVGCQSVTRNKLNKPLGTQPLQAGSNQNVLERELSIARLSERQGKTAQARNLYRRILERAPENQEALHRMGVLAAQDGKWQEATSYLEMAASSQPNAEIYSDLGYVNYRLGKFGVAEDILNRSLDMNPRDERALNNLGLTLASQKKYDRALAVFRQVGTPAEAYSNLAFAQTQHGALELAEKNYHLALEQDAETKIAAVGLIELRKHQRLINARRGQLPQSQIASNRNQNGSDRQIRTTKRSAPPTAMAKQQESSSAARARAMISEVRDGSDQSTQRIVDYALKPRPIAEVRAPTQPAPLRQPPTLAAQIPSLKALAPSDAQVLVQPPKTQAIAASNPSIKPKSITFDAGATSELAPPNEMNRPLAAFREPPREPNREPSHDPKRSSKIKVVNYEAEAPASEETTTPLPRPVTRKVDVQELFQEAPTLQALAPVPTSPVAPDPELKLEPEPELKPETQEDLNKWPEPTGVSLDAVSQPTQSTTVRFK